MYQSAFSCTVEPALLYECIYLFISNDLQIPILLYGYNPMTILNYFDALIVSDQIVVDFFFCSPRGENQYLQGDITKGADFDLREELVKDSNSVLDLVS